MFAYEKKLVDGLERRCRSTLHRIKGDPIYPVGCAVSPDEARRYAPLVPLSELFFAHDGREIHKWVQYLEVYSRHFDTYRTGFPTKEGVRPLRFLELGVFHGGSLQLWRKYFGREASIWGIDIEPRSKEAVTESDLNVRIGSQSDTSFLRAVVKEMGGIDIVLDDGSHKASDQLASFKTLFPLLSDGGLYIVEDVHSAYWRSFGGGLRRRGSFIEVAKDLVDGMHAWYFRRQSPSRASSAKTEISAVCFYDSIVVIEKRHHGTPLDTRVGTPAF